jgi:uncharacterized membrane protein YbhN (UPF0104 family)
LNKKRAYQKFVNIGQRSRLKKFVSWLIALLILAYLLKIIVNDWSTIKNTTLRLDYTLLFVFLFLAIQNLLNIKIWQIILLKFNEKLPYKKCFHIWMYAQIGRYLPGKIWMFLGRIDLAKEAGVDVFNSTCSIYVELATFSVAALILGSLAVLQIGLSLPANQMLVIYGAIGVLLISVHPTIFEKSINIGLRLLRLPTIAISLSFSSIIKFVAFYVIGWQLTGIALFLFISPLAPVSIYSIPLLAGTAALASLIGIISVFSPSGLGVREGVLTLFLGHLIPLPIAATFALLLRILCTITEMFLVFLAFFVKHFDKDILSHREE